MELNKHLIKLIWLLLALSVNTQCYGAKSDTALAGYLIQPGDIIEISVWHEPDLTREVLVRPDGGISLPLAGNLNIEGHTVSQVSNAVTERLAKYIPDPTVTVSIKQLTGNRIYVLGRVQRPGEFQMIRPLTIMQALSMAGGLTPYADEKEILVLRGNEPNQQSFPFNYKEVERGESLGQNIQLQAGDVVVVP
jgi:polysaccharide export outer membrane protein